MRATRTGDDRGQVSVLIVGLVVIAMGLVVVVTNVSRVFLWDRSLAAAADGAAAAAASALDPTSGGSDGTLALSPGAVRAEVTRYVAASDLTARFGQGFDYTVAVAGGTVTVTLQARVHLTMVGPLAGGYADGVPLRSSASARSVVVR